MQLLTARNITKQYAGHKALDEVSIEVPERSIFGLLGPNGAGKTSLIRIINMIMAPDSGELFFAGEKLRAEHVGRIGYLPEERGLYRKMKVGEQAMYLARLKGLSHHDAQTRLKNWFGKFDILNWWNRKVEELSKGMQQKVQFIVTVVHEPSLLIFDEPFSGFDPINVNLLKDEILRLRDNGATILFSTHNMASVEELCDHIALINRSRKVLDGSVKEIRNANRANVFEISFNNFDGELPALLNSDFSVISEGFEEGLRTARIKIGRDRSANDLLNLLIGQVSIHSLQEILPTMNDIFIKKVKEQEIHE
ncbi:MAG: ATP-binding cassette domain-containing protein [Bacteroidetes bacterium]|nr:ATP-binding cassette domain-containing protein [Bacteroidota bacterium]